MRECLRRNRPGHYQLLAAVNAVHTDAATAADTDWSQVLALYDQLYAVTPTPVVALNRAVALAEVEGPASALVVVDGLDLDAYHPYHATRADLLRRLGRNPEAVAAYDRAIGLTANPAEQALLAARRDALHLGLPTDDPGDAPMAGGLVALLDDVVAMAKLAAASVDDVAAAAGRASAKAAGVVVDDTAVTPRYVQGFTPDRELPIIKRIAVGSLRNKLLIIIPAALVLSQFLPWVLTPILMVGGTYLCYEGAEKIWEKLAGHEEHETPCRRRRRRPREDDGDQRHPHRLHPVGRDHGHRAQRGRGRAVPVASDHPGARRDRHHRAGLRRGRA